MSKAHSPSPRASRAKSNPALTALIEQLRAPGEPSLVPVAPPIGIDEALAISLEKAGIHAVIIDQAPIFNRDTLFHALYQNCRMPGYFGFNWDALQDILIDYSWYPAEGYALLWRDPAPLQARDMESWDTFLDVMRDVNENWARTRERGFRLLVPGPA